MKRFHPLKMMLLMSALMLKPVVAMNSTNTNGTGIEPGQGLPFFETNKRQEESDSPFFELMDEGMVVIDGQL